MAVRLYGSEFGDGERVSLSREQIAIFRARLNMKAFHGPGKLTGHAVLLGQLLLDMLGKGGELFPSMETLSRRLGVCLDTIQRALQRLRQLGFLNWTRRLVRIGGRVRQTSNAYHFRCETGTRQQVLKSMNPVPLTERNARVRAQSGSGEDRAAAASAVQQLRSLGMHAEADRLARQWGIARPD